MGYSNFIFALTPTRTLEQVLTVITAHNVLTKSDSEADWDQVGEEIGDVHVFEVTKPYKVGLLRRATQVVSCGNPGGGGTTWGWLFDKGFQAARWSPALDKRLGTSETYMFDDMSAKWIKMSDL